MTYYYQIFASNGEDPFFGKIRLISIVSKPISNVVVVVVIVVVV